jgi:hypothetical protein
MRCTSRWLTVLLTFCLALALPLQGLAAVSGLPGCPHRAPVQQQATTPPCHQHAADASAMADQTDGEQAQPCAGCTACMGGVASAPAPAHANLCKVPGPGQAPETCLGLPAQPGFAHGLERPPRSA